MVGEFLINFRQQKRKQVIRGKKHIISMILWNYASMDLSIYRSIDLLFIDLSIFIYLYLFLLLLFVLINLNI
jgi:hypothetical protein